MCCVLPAPILPGKEAESRHWSGSEIRTPALADGKPGSASRTSCVTSEEAFHLSGPPHSSVE